MSAAIQILSFYSSPTCLLTPSSRSHDIFVSQAYIRQSPGAGNVSAGGPSSDDDYNKIITAPHPQCPCMKVTSEHHSCRSSNSFIKSASLPQGLVNHVSHPLQIYLGQWIKL